MGLRRRQSVVGQTVQHTFAAGYWRPALTSDAGLEDAPPVTAITLRVHAPRRADYGAYVAPMWIAQTVYAQIPYGSTVYVYQ